MLRAAPRSAASIGDRYRTGQASPVEVVTRALAHARHLAARAPTLGPLCGYDDERALEAARDSARRLGDGSARSALEGIPIAIRGAAGVAGVIDSVRSGTADIGFVARLGMLADPDQAPPKPLYLKPPDAKPQVPASTLSPAEAP